MVRVVLLPELSYLDVYSRFLCSEYAGEIKDAFPDKKVTIVHSDSQLLNSTYPNKYRKRVLKDLESRGVNVVFNDYVDDFESAPIKTRSGRRIDGDLVVRPFLVLRIKCCSFSNFRSSVYRCPRSVAAQELALSSHSVRMRSTRGDKSRSRTRSKSSRIPTFMRLATRQTGKNKSRLQRHPSMRRSQPRTFFPRLLAPLLRSPTRVSPSSSSSQMARFVVVHRNSVHPHFLTRVMSCRSRVSRTSACYGVSQ